MKNLLAALLFLPLAALPAVADDGFPWECYVAKACGGITTPQAEEWAPDPVPTFKPRRATTKKPQVQKPTEYSVSDAGLNLIKRFEGFATKAYWDFRQWSVGYGTVARRGERVTRAKAEAKLRRELAQVERWLERNVKVPLTQNQVDGLTSFGFNLGTSRLNDLRADLNAGKFQKVARNMRHYNNAGGRPHRGLTMRRKAESRLLLS